MTLLEQNKAGENAASDAMVDRESLPYRMCAGVALLNENNQVWLGERIPRKWDAAGEQFLWQMPQGGVDEGEQLEEAALRELYEETGVNSVQIIAEVEDWLTYDLPDELLGIALKGRYRGQKQKWFFVKFLGEEAEINLSPPGHEAEFRNWRWADVDELPETIIPFKRQVYEKIVFEIKQLPIW